MYTKQQEDELDAFLWEAEYVNNQVKGIIDGTISIDKITQNEKALKEKKAKAETTKKFKEDEAERAQLERFQRGFPGKGEKDNYKYLCKHCWVEYRIIEMPTCWHCNRPTMTCVQRRAELMSKLDDYKVEVNKRTLRKKEFANWVSTENILKGQHFSNYKKWNYYEEPSDEEKEPILPRDDPNFMALEKDLIETKKKREISHSIAEKWKEEANGLMKESKFFKAIEKYTEAIDEERGNMPYYTNRAFAYIKVEDYDNAIKDCDKVVEFIEMFEEDTPRHMEIYMKALIRKSIALSKQREYSESLETIKTAMERLTKNPIKNFPLEELQKVHDNIIIERDLHAKASEVTKKADSDPNFKKNHE